MPSEKRKIGDIGEDFAVNYLIRNKYQIIERNYWKPFGEIDIIAKSPSDKGNSTVLVEVKTSIMGGSLMPQENMTMAKISKLKRIASFYVSKNNLLNKSYQIDVILVNLYKNLTLANVEHLENINLS